MSFSAIYFYIETSRYIFGVYYCPIEEKCWYVYLNVPLVNEQTPADWFFINLFIWKEKSQDLMTNSVCFAVDRVFLLKRLNTQLEKSFVSKSNLFQRLPSPDELNEKYRESAAPSGWIRTKWRIQCGCQRPVMVASSIKKKEIQQQRTVTFFSGYVRVDDSFFFVLKYGAIG